MFQLPKLNVTGMNAEDLDIMELPGVGAVELKELMKIKLITLLVNNGREPEINSSEWKLAYN